MKTGTKTWIGVTAWIAFVAAARPAPTSPAWTYVLLAFAALVLLPLTLELVVERRDAGRIARYLDWARIGHIPAATLLAISFGMRPGLWAMLVALPWAAVTVFFAAAGLGRMFRDTWARSLDRMAGDVGLGYLAIGGLWLLVDRSGVKPHGFSSDSVALMAAHFHFAGFVLPLLAGQVARQMPDSRMALRGVVGLVLGVPALAVGISVAQLGWTPVLEAAAGCGLALAGITVAILLVRTSLDASDHAWLTRTLLGLSGAALFFTMVMLGAYSARTYVVILPWLDLGEMRAIYGSLFAFGVGLCGLLGWKRYYTAERE